MDPGLRDVDALDRDGDGPLAFEHRVTTLDLLTTESLLGHVPELDEDRRPDRP